MPIYYTIQELAWLVQKVVQCKAFTFEPRGSKKYSKYGYFHPPGCEIEILKIRDDFMKQPKDS